MSEPNYGHTTLCRPLVANVPAPPAGWTRATCPYCGAACWATAIEPRPLPPGWCAACTNCALRRGSHQAEMDRERYERENKT
jgi:hypothetical protein